jgi:hypothetical protein
MGEEKKKPVLTIDPKTINEGESVLVKSNSINRYA